MFAPNDFSSRLGPRTCRGVGPARRVGDANPGRRANESLGRVDYEQHQNRKYIFPGMWKTWDPKTGLRHPLREEQLEQLKLVDEKTAALAKLMQTRGRVASRLRFGCVEQLQVPRLDASPGT